MKRMVRMVGVFGMILLLLFSFTACDDGESYYNDGYEEGYSAGYDEGYDSANDDIVLSDVIDDYGLTDTLEYFEKGEVLEYVVENIELSVIMESLLDQYDKEDLLEEINDTSNSSSVSASNDAYSSDSDYGMPMDDDIYSYIGNKSSKKFHKYTCSSVGDMKESNIAYFETREEAVNLGYKPCQRCYP